MIHALLVAAVLCADAKAASLDSARDERAASTRDEPAASTRDERVASAPATATVPLAEYLSLNARAPVVPPPPVDAVIANASLKGRLTADALEVTSHWVVDVLADQWAKVPLVRLRPGTYVIELPQIPNASLSACGDALCLWSNHAGSYSFDVKLLLRSSGPRRTVTLEAAQPGVVVPMQLEADAALVHVLEPASDDAVYPVKGAWTVAWQPVTETKKAAPVERPPLAPSVPTEVARFVSTVEGKAQLTVTYALKLDREQPLEIRIPAGHRLERLAINGLARPVKADSQVLQLTVAPAHPGDTDGSVELVMVHELGVFHLSGQLVVTLPQVSWPVAEVNATVHLPVVFDYQRLGGSLEPREVELPPVPQIPGKQLAYRQFLVSTSAPTLELRYSVDLKGRYFHARLDSY